MYTDTQLKLKKKLWLFGDAYMFNEAPSVPGGPTDCNRQVSQLTVFVENKLTQ